MNGMCNQNPERLARLTKELEHARLMFDANENKERGWSEVVARSLQQKINSLSDDIRGLTGE